jgi:hypothetical protein
MDYKTMENELERIGFNVIDVKDKFANHFYHIYAVYKNNYALSICQGRGLNNGIGTFEVALGTYNNNSFELAYKGMWKDGVLGWKTPENVIELAKSVKRFKIYLFDDGEKVHIIWTERVE